MRQACGDAHMKTILATGELATYKNVRIASMICMMAGADFIKTSTGKEPTNATLAVSLVMARCIREYQARTGYKIGFQPAGGISTAKVAIQYLVMLHEPLGSDWLDNSLFRFGASSLANNILMQILKQETGCYQSPDYFSIG